MKLKPSVSMRTFVQLEPLYVSAYPERSVATQNDDETHEIRSICVVPSMFWGAPHDPV